MTEKAVAKIPSVVKGYPAYINWESGDSRRLSSETKDEADLKHS